MNFLIVRLIIPSALFFICSCTVSEVIGPTHVQDISSDSQPEMKHQYVEVSRREGVKQKFLLIKPPEPWASAVLFTGDGGYVGVNPYGYIHCGNFLVRNRHLFALQGLMVAVVDVPSDREGLWGFRVTKAHALDIKGVIAYLRDLADIPVWLIGTSRGCASPANVAARLEDGGPDGIVLTSCVSQRSRRGHSVFDVNLLKIRVPTLVVHNKKDACSVTPYFGAERIVNSLWKAPRKDLICYDHNSPRGGDPCGPWSNHGYYGIDEQVVKDISEWIKSHGSGKMHRKQ